MDSQRTPSSFSRLLKRLGLPQPPSWMLAGLITLVVASWLPLALIARARFMTSDQPRIHIPQDMGTQPKYREQMASDVFADGRADRLPIPRTVGRGQLEEDDHYYRGFAQKWNPQKNLWDITFFSGLPAQVPLSPALLARGQERFDIYCASCHGLDGSGNGPINARALELQESKWVQPSSLHTDTVRTRPDGHLYNTINNGIRNMPPHGAQISVPDRWAIVAYVRALQLSQNAPANALPPDKLQTLR